MPKISKRCHLTGCGSMQRDKALKDDDEMNAEEYAIISDTSMDVVKLLQKASQRVMKRETI